MSRWCLGTGLRQPCAATSGLPEWESIVVSSASVCVPRPRAESALGRSFGTMQPPLLVPPEPTEQPRVRVRTNSLPGKPKPGPEAVLPLSRDPPTVCVKSHAQGTSALSGYLRTSMHNAVTTIHGLPPVAKAVYGVVGGGCAVNWFSIRGCLTRRSE